MRRVHFIFVCFGGVSGLVASRERREGRLVVERRGRLARCRAASAAGLSTATTTALAATTATAIATATTLAAATAAKATALRALKASVDLEEDLLVLLGLGLGRGLLLADEERVLLGLLELINAAGPVVRAVVGRAKRVLLGLGSGGLLSEVLLVRNRVVLLLGRALAALATMFLLLLRALVYMYMIRCCVHLCLCSVCTTRM